MGWGSGESLRSKLNRVCTGTAVGGRTGRLTSLQAKVATDTATANSTKNATGPPISSDAEPAQELATAPRRPMPNIRPIPVARSHVG